MKKQAPFNIIFDKCPVCGGTGDYDRTYYSPSTLALLKAGNICGSTSEGPDLMATLGAHLSKFTASGSDTVKSLSFYGGIYESTPQERTVLVGVYDSNLTLLSEGSLAVISKSNLDPWWITVSLDTEIALTEGSSYYLAIYSTGLATLQPYGVIDGGDGYYLYLEVGTSETSLPASITAGDLWHFEEVAYTPAVYVTTVEYPYETTNDTGDGNGYELVDYKGEKMCSKCRKTKMMADESRVMMDRSHREDDERAEMGFVKTYTQ